MSNKGLDTATAITYRYGMEALPSRPNHKRECESHIGTVRNAETGARTAAIHAAVSSWCPHAEEVRKVLCRLARRPTLPSPKSVLNQSSREQMAITDAERSRRKKSPRLGTIGQICAAWSEAHPKNQTDSHAVARELAAISGPLEPRHLTALHIVALAATWNKRLARSTTYHRTRQLHRLIAHIAALTGRHDLLAAIPRARRPSPRTTIAEPGEIEKVLAAAPNWMRVIILLAAHAGLRRSDCLAVAPVHYNADARALTIKQHKTGATVTIPVTAALAQMLDHAPTGDPATPFYELFHESPIGHSGLNTAWQRIKRKAGVNPNLWLHDLRRTIAVSLYEVSKDLRVVEQMLGHKSLGSTVAYLEHRDPEKLRPYLDALYRPKGPVQ